MQKSKIFFTIIPLLIFSCFVKGNNPDSLHSFNSFKLYKFNNYWLETGNNAGIAFNSFNNYGIVSTGYQNKSGDFHRIRESNKLGKFYLFSESYKKIKSINFYGSFTYANSNEEGMLWNEVFDPYRGTPYIIGDSIPGGTYHKETYRLIGGLARRISTQLILGVNINYFVAIGAKQKDPRPQNVVMNFAIAPSFIYELSNIKIGFDAGYRNRKEELSNTQVATDETDPTLFFFKGFGVTSYDRNSNYDRFYTQKEYFGGVQLESKLWGMKSLTEVRVSYALDIVEDGSLVFKAYGGDWKATSIQFNHQSGFRQNNSIHKINILGNFLNGDGIEYTQKRDWDEDNHLYYLTLSKNLMFNRTTVSANIKYNYLKLKTDNHIDWEIESNVGFVMNQEKYYIVPEILSANYLNANVGLEVVKNYYYNNLQIVPEFSASYTYNLSSKSNLYIYESAVVEGFKEVYYHDFNFYTTDVLELSAGLTMGIEVKKAKNMDQLYIKTYYERWQTMNDENMGFITGTLGIVF